jgi:glutamate--cysteine ligase
VSSLVPVDDTLLISPSQLVDYVSSREKSREQWVIGTEHEKFGWWPDRGSPPTYDDPRGIRAVLEAFTTLGWVPHEENGAIVALARGGATITLEPGGQLELSGAPLKSLSAMRDEFDEHLVELKSVSDPLGVAWSGLGFMPWGTPFDMPLMPKPRYEILQRQLLSAGSLGVHMMRQTATVQANYDFENERDAFRKFRAALWIQPIVTAMFASSPMVDGAYVSESSFRAAVWQDTDPGRCRLPRVLWSEGATYNDYVDWALDVPMLFVHRGGEYVDCRGRRFREFMDHGYAGYVATVGDFAMHLSTVFPDVRMKTHLEVRAADMGSRDYVLALPALHAGILYDESALDQTLGLFNSMDHAQWEALTKSVPLTGLKTNLDGRSVLNFASDLLEIASEGLSRWEPSALEFLDPVKESIQRGECPADQLRLRANDSASLLETTRLVPLASNGLGKT